jgi:hypothetical protein
MSDSDAELEVLNTIARQKNIKHLEWSYSDVPSDKLNEPHTFQGITHVQYGGYRMKSRVVGNTWLDIWKASDACFAKNLKKHGQWYACSDGEEMYALDDHIFIELFKRSGNVLRVLCGS